jgi:NAD(P)H-hydrate repair Nnr-like enzyme with NAD(P)H-hydrate dehydratase domain
MPGAALLAATAALRGGAGYVQVLAGQAGLPGAPPELVVRDGPLEDAGRQPLCRAAGRAGAGPR